MHFLRGLKNIFFKNRMAGFEKIAKGEFFEMPNCRLPVNFVRYAEPKIFLQKTQKMQRHSDIYTGKDTGNYVLYKIACKVKNRLHSRQQLCRLRGKLRAPPSLQVARETSRFALVASAAADRNWNRTAQNFFEILLAIPYSAALQKISIFENAALVRGSAYVYTQVCMQTCD